MEPSATSVKPVFVEPGEAEAQRSDNPALEGSRGAQNLTYPEGVKNAVRLIFPALTAVVALGLSSCASETETATATAPASAAATGAEAPSATPLPPQELPRGGRELFPEYRLVGYSGLEGAPGIGRLYGDLDAKGAEIEQLAKQYKDGRKILPVYELITTLVVGTPQKDGKYRIQKPDKLIQRYLDAARRQKAILLLNIQPGRSEFLPEMKHYEKFLKEPDVGVALDPEWAMDSDQVPLQAYGNTSAAERNEAAAYLSGLVQQYNLPEKAMVYHQVHPMVVDQPRQLEPHEGVAVIQSVDGIGSPGAKIDTYDVLMKKKPKFVHAGFKLFYEEDVATGQVLMTPKEVLKLKPQPEYVLYE